MTSIRVLRYVLGLAVAGYSLELLMRQLHGHAHHLLVLLGLAELVAAILFLVPRTSWCGGIALIIVFLIAAIFHLLHGEYDSLGYLAVYGAAAFAVISAKRGSSRT